jgi:hypothetical protein
MGSYFETEDNDFHTVFIGEGKEAGQVSIVPREMKL